MWCETRKENGSPRWRSCSLNRAFPQSSWEVQDYSLKWQIAGGVIPTRNVTWPGDQNSTAKAVSLLTQDLLHPKWLHIHIRTCCSRCGLVAVSFRRCFVTLSLFCTQHDVIWNSKVKIQNAKPTVGMVSYTHLGLWRRFGFVFLGLKGRQTNGSTATSKPSLDHGLQNSHMVLWKEPFQEVVEGGLLGFQPIWTVQDQQLGAGLWTLPSPTYAHWPCRPPFWVLVFGDLARSQVHQFWKLPPPLPNLQADALTRGMVHDFQPFQPPSLSCKK